MKKIGLIALIVVLSLGIIGVGYAAWSQTLHITGTASAATFNVNFTSATNPTAPVGTGGAAVATIVDGQHVTINVANAYPNWSGDFGLIVTNNSTIPVTFALSKDASPTDPLSLWTASGDPVGKIAAGGTFTYTIHVIIPDWTSTTNSAASSNANYTLLASQ